LANSFSPTGLGCFFGASQRRPAQHIDNYAKSVCTWLTLTLLFIALLALSCCCSAWRRICCYCCRRRRVASCCLYKNRKRNLQLGQSVALTCFCNRRLVGRRWGARKKHFPSLRRAKTAKCLWERQSVGESETRSQSMTCLDFLSRKPTNGKWHCVSSVASSFVPQVAPRHLCVQSISYARRKVKGSPIKLSSQGVSSKRTLQITSKILKTPSIKSTKLWKFIMNFKMLNMGRRILLIHIVCYIFKIFFYSNFSNILRWFVNAESQLWVANGNLKSLPKGNGHWSLV